MARSYAGGGANAGYHPGESHASCLSLRRVLVYGVLAAFVLYFGLTLPVQIATLRSLFTGGGHAGVAHAAHGLSWGQAAAAGLRLQGQLYLEHRLGASLAKAAGSSAQQSGREVAAAPQAEAGSAKDASRLVETTPEPRPWAPPASVESVASQQHGALQMDPASVAAEPPPALLRLENYAAQDNVAVTSKPPELIANVNVMPAGMQPAASTAQTHNTMNGVSPSPSAPPAAPPGGANDADVAEGYPPPPTPQQLQQLKWGVEMPLEDALRKLYQEWHPRDISEEFLADYMPGRAMQNIPLFGRERNDSDARSRVEFFYQCRNLGQTSAIKIVGSRPSQTTIDRGSIRAHGFELFDRTLDYRIGAYSTWANFSGPWIENYFVETFARPIMTLLTQDGQPVPWFSRQYVTPPASFNRSRGLLAALPRELEHIRDRIADFRAIVEPYDYQLFYPAVPVFIRWTDQQIRGKFDQRIAREMGRALQNRFRQDTTYFVVIQYADGVYLRRVWTLRKYVRNMIVLSAGGSGNVPIPLLAQPRAPIDTPPFGQHTYDITFAGSAREGVRKTALSNLREAAEVVPDFKVQIVDLLSDNSAWIELMRSSMLQFAPRGTGLTSFRLYEALQLGLIPVYVYDIPWLPYQKPQLDPALPLIPSIWHEIAHLVRSDQLPVWLRGVIPGIKADPGAYERMKARILQVRDNYFTYEGVMQHVHQFLVDPQSSELYCSKRPFDP